MSKQPEALRLADSIDKIDTPYPLERKAAAELRRLHEENAALRQEHAEDQSVINVWRGRAQRAEDECTRQHALIAELVEALQQIESGLNSDARSVVIARAALSKAKEQQ